MYESTNKQMRRVQRVFLLPESANDLKTSHGDMGDVGFVPDCPSHLSFHNLLLSKARYSLPSLKSFSRPLRGKKLQVLSHELYLGSPKGAETWRNGRCHASSKWPPCLIWLSLCANIHLKISIHI